MKGMFILCTSLVKSAETSNKYLVFKIKSSTMVMMTRSSYRKACESFDSSNSSRNTDVLPWCSMRKVRDKKGRKVAQKEVQSAYPLRENIWEYLHEDKKDFFKRKSRACCKQPAKKRGRAVIAVAFFFVIVGMITFFWMSHQNTDNSLITRIIPRTTLISLFGFDYETTSVDEECCSRMKHLAAALFRAENVLRSTLRLRRTMMLTSQGSRIGPPSTIDQGYIEGVAVSRGRGTEEWGSRVALWGVVPLWRAAPPPHTVLASRRPVPSDCWPFGGSTGELVFDLPSAMKVGCISLEHVRPDTAFSAPRLFSLYAILANGTWIEAVEGEYKHSGPAKQYYLTRHKKTPAQKFIFRILSNHGNPQYTCVYRVHLYESHAGTW